ncbi:MAG TPA: peptidoglycan-binding domain-containing protein [Acidimicrobiales bacterium]|nr:peptidoglycan-binding domain-containing protein [Acidimicrobiales bacterium]
MRPDHRGAHRRAAVASIVFTACFLAAACSSDSTNGVTAAQTRVSKAEKGVADAQAALDKATAQFCGEAKDYIEAVDRYGKAFDESAATVGDIKTAGADLEQPRSSVVSGAEAVTTARDDLAKAQQELTDAKGALAAAQASAASQTLPPTTATSTTTTEPLVPPATVDRVKKAEADFAAATQDVTDQSPLTEATVQVNSAGLALEMAWLQLFNEAGCFTDEQQQKAATAVHDYTAALQTALHTTGYYAGEVDGVYGPSTAEAVQQLQTQNRLPPTGWVDRATAAALDAELLAKGGATATKELTQTAAVQSTLKLAGYWTGPVDGQWTPELTDALKEFQTALDVPPTGAADAATIAALEETIANAKSASTASTTTTSVTTTASSS